MLTLKIEQDIEPINPRDWDNLGTMVCWHRNYNLGDQQPDCAPSEFEFPKGCIKLPLFLYDHSGITMNTTGFTCPWDSGQVGWIFVTRDRMNEEFGTNWDEKRAIEILQGEVETYDQYLTGDVWGYIVEDELGNTVDSCWDFYGYDYCKETGQDSLEWLKKKREAELAE